MRHRVKNSLASAANTQPGGWFLARLKGLSGKLDAVITYIDRQRQTETREDLKTKIIRERFSDLTVRHGAFANLKYPGIAASGSALLPKLLGSYEVEIAPMIDKISQQAYTDVVDIGCAEGYYAVGFGLMFPKAKVHAYDVDAGARRLCQKMASKNGIADRLHMGRFCDPDTLITLGYAERVLFVADCEGYEAELFTDHTKPALVSHDVLIECHDFKDPEISDRIAGVFGDSHDVHRIRSRETYVKAHELEYPEFDGYSYEIRKFMVDEARRHSVIWLFLSAKTAADNLA